MTEAVSTPSVFITGCAKSGTTLLLRLMTAFPLVPQLPVDGLELGLPEFAARVAASPNTPMVAKRTFATVFSGLRIRKQQERQIKLIEDHGILIINIIRDGRDVLTSDNGYVTASRWITSMKQRRSFRDSIALTVRYEDLVSNPNDVQEAIAVAIGLQPTHPFSRYPEFVPPALDGTRYLGNTIFTSSVGRGLQNKAVPSKLRAGFLRELNLAGYCGVRHPSAKIGLSPCVYARGPEGTRPAKTVPNHGIEIADDVDVLAFAAVVNGTERPTVIGRGSRLLHRAHVGHDCLIGEDVIIGAGSLVAGFAEVGDRTELKIGVLVRNRVKIGSDCVIGMGAVVVKDVPDNHIAYGNPARARPREE